jgi:hypothetical protein
MACVGNVNRDIDITVLCRACTGNVNRDINITVLCRGNRVCIGNVNRDLDILTDIGVWQLGVFSNTIPGIFFNSIETTLVEKFLLFRVATCFGHRQGKPL